MNRNELRMKNEGRGDQTARNLVNRAKRKEREYWGEKYPGSKLAKWPEGIKREKSDV